MITFACSACQKKFSVKDELAGKKGKCPSCGQLAAIPSPVVSPANAEMATLPPAPGPAPSLQDEWPTTLTHTHSSDPDATRGFDMPKACHDPSLTDFLAPPQAEDELGRLGEYRIVKILGHGGMGVVFQAEDPKLKRSVAVKAMLPALAASASAGQRFLREAQAMAAVKHNHVATIYQVDEERGVPFLAMEFLAGEPLDERLKRDGKLPLADVLRIGREIALGLAAAHATGLIHRDVKPANIWLETPRNRVKILDFGLARAAAHDEHLTQEGAIIGTPAYMAPEQARGEKVDGRCDLFSLGGVLYRMLTGEQPFKGADTMSLLMALAADEPRPVRELRPDAPPALAALVKRLLTKDAGSRPESARAVADALAEMEADRLPMPPAGPDAAATAKRANVATKRRKKARPRWLLPVAYGGLLLALLVGVGAFTLFRIPSDQGEYIIHTDDPDFSFRVNKGAVALEDRKTSRTYDLKVVYAKKPTGEYELEATDAAAGLAFKTKTFTIKRGEKVVLEAWFERKSAVAAKQAPAVAAKLKDLNPGFDGVVKPRIEGGVVTELTFLTDKVTDVSPVRALPGIRVLICRATWNTKGQLADLSPLKGMNLKEMDIRFTKVSDLSPLEGMKLTKLECGVTQVSDLSPLKGMPLTILDCGITRVTDLSPLKDMKLTELICHYTRISDLSPLKDMKLTHLSCHNTKVSDLSPLKNMKLTHLDCGATQVIDLSPLKDMKLTQLKCGETKVTDLSPLKDMKLTVLWCNSTKVTDLSPLKGMLLKDLQCDFKPERDAEILRSLKTLVKINGKPAKEFWHEVDAKKP